MTDPLPTTSATSTASISILPSDRSGAGITDAVRAQILATEHWSLLATRSMTWNEIFSRASMFITVLSAAVVALALVAQATAFGSGFRLFAFIGHPSTEKGNSSCRKDIPYDAPLSRFTDQPHRIYR